jgi:hypothetical protein
LFVVAALIASTVPLLRAIHIQPIKVLRTD